MRAQSVQRVLVEVLSIIVSTMVPWNVISVNETINAATIPLDSLTLGAVIQINGQNFVKIGDNRYLSVCAIESNKCLVKGQEYNEELGKCVCTTASANAQTWTGCSSLATWTPGSSQADNTNTVCLYDDQSKTFYEVHKHSDNQCYLTSSTNNTPESLGAYKCSHISCQPGITNGACNTTTGQCSCKVGSWNSDLGGCVVTNGCSNPTSWMQDWTGCNGLSAWSATDTSGDTACLADRRDGKTYMVRKLPDGRCWMVNNLAYGASDKYGGTDVCADRTEMTNANSEDNIKNKFGGQSNSTTSYNLWGDCRGTKNVADAYKDGYYYNWAAAMGQTNTWWGSSTQPTYQTNVKGLCPDGWVLPTGGTVTDSDFHKLATAVNGSHASSYSDSKTYTFFNNSNYGWHGLYSGYTNNTGGLGNQGSSAYYWSSTFNNANNAYSLNYNSSRVNPEYSHYKYYGFSVRCLRN